MSGFEKQGTPLHPVRTRSILAIIPGSSSVRLPDQGRSFGSHHSSERTSVSFGSEDQKAIRIPNSLGGPFGYDCDPIDKAPRPIVAWRSADACHGRSAPKFIQCLPVDDPDVCHTRVPRIHFDPDLCFTTSRRTSPERRTGICQPTSL